MRGIWVMAKEKTRHLRCRRQFFEIFLCGPLISLARRIFVFVILDRIVGRCEPAALFPHAAFFQWGVVKKDPGVVFIEFCSQFSPCFAPNCICGWNNLGGGQRLTGQRWVDFLIFLNRRLVCYFSSMADAHCIFPRINLNIHSGIILPSPKIHFPILSVCGPFHESGSPVIFWSRRKPSKMKMRPFSPEPRGRGLCEVSIRSRKFLPIVQPHSCR